MQAKDTRLERLRAGRSRSYDTWKDKAIGTETVHQRPAAGSGEGLTISERGGIL